MGAAKFRKLPVIIDAICFDGSSQSRRDVLEFTGVTGENARTIYWRAPNNYTAGRWNRGLRKALMASDQAGDADMRGLTAAPARKGKRR